MSDETELNRCKPCRVCGSKPITSDPTSANICYHCKCKAIVADKIPNLSGLRKYWNQIVHSQYSPNAYELYWTEYAKFSSELDSNTSPKTLKVIYNTIIGKLLARVTEALNAEVAHSFKLAKIAEERKVKIKMLNEKIAKLESEYKQLSDLYEYKMSK